MAKKRQMRQRLRDKQQKGQEGDSSQASKGEGPFQPEIGSTRVHRKIARTSKFLQKLQTTQAALSVRSPGVSKKSRRKSKGGVSSVDSAALGSMLESLGGALPDPLSIPQRRQGTISGKEKQRIVVRETRQMSAVLANPAFKLDPFAAIQQHLERRVPSIAGASNDRSVQGLVGQKEVRGKEKHKKGIKGKGK